MEKPDARANDAGLLLMLLLVIVGTLIMAWVADQSPHESLDAAAKTEIPAVSAD